VLGWWVVAKKGAHVPGDKVIYVEVDALLPEWPELEFLRKGCWRPAITTGTGEVLLRAGFRIKTIRLRGQVSQGLCLGIDHLPPGAPVDEGTDVTELLDIVKYEPPVPVGLGGRIRGPFPGFVPKTDETRVQVLEAVLARQRGRTFHVTEKLDGTSFTAFLRAGEFGLCSRNLWLDETDHGNALCRIAAELEVEPRLRALREREGFDVAVQAELIGPGIQGNRYALRRAALRVFNVVDLDRGRLVDHARARDLAGALGLETVPPLGELALDHDVDALVELAAGPSALNANTPREGLVLRPGRDEDDPDLGRLSFKVINPAFLLRYDDA